MDTKPVPPAGIISKKTKNVLLITQNKNSILLSILEKLDFIKVKSCSPNILASLNQYSFIFCDLIIYDLNDGGYIDTPENEVLENFIKKEGGSILVTHDHFTCRKGPLKLLGLKSEPRKTLITYNKVRICWFDHQILKSFNDLSNWKFFDIKDVHLSNSNLDYDIQYDCKKVIESYDNYSFPYLVANQIEKGRSVYWEAGHSGNTLTDCEKKLFENIVAWLVKYEK